MKFFEFNGQQIIWRNHGETVVVEPWGPDSLRVRAVLMGDVADNRFALLDPVESPDVELTLIDDEHATLRNGKITAKMDVCGWKRRVRITFVNQKGEVLLRETDGANALVLQSRKFEPIIGGDHALTATFDGFDGEHIYGMGQYQEEYIDWKGCTLELAHRNSQASVPVIMSSRGYGFMWHNPAIGWVSFGRNRTSWHADTTKQLDYWITAGDKPADISLNYARATGFAPMMPEYGLGFWQCKLRYWNQEQLLEVAREYKRRNLPIDVIVCDFFHWPHMGDYRFDPEFFPDPEAMVKELQEMGIELMVSVWPQVALTSENYDEMLQQGLLVRAEYGEQIGMRFVEDSMFFDATNPRARKYVWSKIKKNYYDYGIRVFWLDEAEPEWGTYDFKQYRYHIGSSQQVGNIYPQYYSRLFYEGMIAQGQENPVNLVRWFQWGCYCPVMRLHGDRAPAEPVFRKDGTRVLNSGSDNEVWSFGEEAYPILVKYMNRREEMRDYVRGLMQEAHEAGTPLLRGMFYEFPEDENCAVLQDQYMFGGKYLVAPVMEPGARTRSVYLPDGQWRNVDTGDVLTGGQRVTVPAPLEVIPVFEKI